MKSGLVSVTFRGKNTDEIIALCKKNAVDVIEWGRRRPCAIRRL